MLTLRELLLVAFVFPSVPCERRQSYVAASGLKQQSRLHPTKPGPQMIAFPKSTNFDSPASCIMGHVSAARSAEASPLGGIITD